MIEHANMPKEIRRYVGGFVARRRWTALLRRGGIALTFAILWLLIWAMIDRLLPLPGLIRFILLVCDVVGFFWLLGRPIAALLSRRLDWRAAAAQIEQRDPRFIGRLETAVSQLMLPRHLRGSTPMVETIVSQADVLAGQKLSLPLVPMEPALRPWLMALAIALLMTVLAFSSWLNLPQLLHRAFEPFGHVGPVTTTQLLVETANVDVPQGQSVTVTARAQRLPGDEMMIHLIDRSAAGGASETAQAMAPDSQGRFSFVLNSVDRDWQYRISGGDARSSLYTIRVLRHPAIAEFRIRYIYPAYTALAPATTVNQNGAMQAPVGTQAVVDLVSTEPLSSATFIVNGQRIAARAEKQADLYEASIPITQSSSYQLELHSARGVANADDEGSAGLTIQAIPDQPPQPRWEFATRNLFVTTSSIATLPYRITDDYGAGSISLTIDVPNQPARQIALADSDELLKDQHGQATLNLAEFGLKSGDLLTARLNAADATKQIGSSSSINLIVVPHAIDAQDNLRVASLDIAATLAKSLADESADALRSDVESQQSGNPDPAARNSRMIRASVLAGQLADELTRALSHTDSQALATGLIDLIDRATIRQLRSKPFVPNDDPLAAQKQRDWLTQNADQAHQLQTQIEALRAGETAAMASNALKDFQSLLPSASRPDQPHALLLREALQQAGREVDDALKGIGVDPDDPALDASLADTITKRAQMLKAMSADPDPAARLLQAGGTIQRDELTVRSLTMARAEAVRRNADFAQAAKLLAVALDKNDPPARQFELLAIQQAAQIAAGDFAAADQTAKQLHQISTAKPSADLNLLVPWIDHAADLALARAKAIAADSHNQKQANNDSVAAMNLANQQAARLRVESLPQIAALLWPANDQSGAMAPAVETFSTTTPSSDIQAISGFDEPLRVYFQALGRNR